VKAILPILLGASAAFLAPLGPIASVVQAESGSAATRGQAAFAIDCNAPASPNEVLICTDADLLVRDRTLASQAAAGASDEAAAARLQWVRDQRDLCDSVECLRRAYGTDLPETTGEATI
jgi:uncharacterized protein